ncbi:MAG: phosphatidate cytidylyltransferase [Bacteroidetes bacterium]|nr:phosphatidate cytidylyltransferase [Bacteroidota bacterium]
MALNRTVFKTRTLTAVVFAAVMLLGLFWNKWSFLVLFSMIHFGCWFEYLKLTEKIQKNNIHIYLKMGLMLIGFGIMLLFCDHTFQILGYGIRDNFSLPMSAAGFIYLILGVFVQKKIELKAFTMSAAGILYVSLSIGLLLHLYSYTGTIIIPLLIILSIWINDTMAYIVGSLIGKTPLSKISPKKTLEGTIGGIILAAIAIGFLLPLFFEKKQIVLNHWLLFGLALVAAVAGTFGDLFESKLKRMAGVKDSGTFMPGHGGFLDRFDSLLFAIPAVWIFLKLVSISI